MDAMFFWWSLTPETRVALQFLGAPTKLISIRVTTHTYVTCVPNLQCVTQSRVEGQRIACAPICWLLADGCCLESWDADLFSQVLIIKQSSDCPAVLVNTRRKIGQNVTPLRLIAEGRETVSWQRFVRKRMHRLDVLSLHTGLNQRNNANSAQMLKAQCFACFGTDCDHALHCNRRSPTRKMDLLKWSALQVWSVLGFKGSKWISKRTHELKMFPQGLYHVQFAKQCHWHCNNQSKTWSKLSIGVQPTLIGCLEPLIWHPYRVSVDLEKHDFLFWFTVVRQQS